MMDALEMAAPAKVNLSLRILGKREDGFHELTTVMAPIGLADQLKLRLDSTQESGVRLACSDPSLPTGSDNLAVAAAEAFLEATTGALEFGGGVEIDLVKKVPSGAGLGGGSADAAAVLAGLNQMFDTPLSLEELAEVGGKLGSDVPFFLYGQVCRATGRGEIVEPIEFPHQLNLVLAKPDFGVPTPWAYQRWAESREIPGVHYEVQDTPWGEMVNDLERPVFEKYLLLGHLKTWFLEQPEVEASMLSGSGATVYAVMKQEQSAGALVDKARGEFGENLWLHATSIEGKGPPA